MPDIGIAWWGTFRGRNCPNAAGCMYLHTITFLIFLHSIWNPCRAQQLDARHPGVSRFYYQHEMAHVTVRTSVESEADCQAARVLKNDRAALSAAVAHFRARGNEYIPGYGYIKHMVQLIHLLVAWWIVPTPLFDALVLAI